MNHPIIYSWVPEGPNDENKVRYCCDLEVASSEQLQDYDVDGEVSARVAYEMDDSDSGGTTGIFRSCFVEGPDSYAFTKARNELIDSTRSENESDELLDIDAQPFIDLESALTIRWLCGLE